MPLPAKFVFASLGLAASLQAATFNYYIAGDDAGPWPQIFSAIGLTRAVGGLANLFVVRQVTPGSIPQWIQRVEQGGVVVLEGESDLAAALGVKPSSKRVVVRSIVDRRAPKLPIIWETSLEIPVFDLHKDATV